MSPYLTVLVVLVHLSLLSFSSPSSLESRRIPIIRTPRRAIDRRDPDSTRLSAMPHNHTSYYTCPVIIGEGPGKKTFNLNFDTGSGDLWVFSTLMPTIQRGSHVLYDPDASTSSTNLKKTWDAKYGGGSLTSEAKGLAFTDTVNLGGP